MSLNTDLSALPIVGSFPSTIGNYEGWGNIYQNKITVDISSLGLTEAPRCVLYENNYHNDGTLGLQGVFYLINSSSTTVQGYINRGTNMNGFSGKTTLVIYP